MSVRYFLYSILYLPLFSKIIDSLKMRTGEKKIIGLKEIHMQLTFCLTKKLFFHKTIQNNIVLVSV